MAKHVVQTMLPGEHGKVNKASLWEGTTKQHILHIIHSLHILHIQHTVHIIFFFREGRWWAGGFLLDWSLAVGWAYCWKNQICKKRLYLRFEREESWDRPGVSAFGRVNGSLAFEAAYIIDRGGVPLLSVFYSDKSFEGNVVPSNLS